MLAILNSEARFPIPIKKGLGGVLFYDGGNVYSKISFAQFTGNYSNSIGIGLRYQTPVGPVRIDVPRRASFVDPTTPRLPANVRATRWADELWSRPDRAPPPRRASTRRRRHDGSASCMFKADNELGRRYVRNLIELPLKNCAALNAWLL